jgi:hypothetical protein
VLKRGVSVNTVNNELGRNGYEILTHVEVTFFEFVRSEEQYEMSMTLSTTRKFFSLGRHILLNSKQKVGDESYIRV